MEYRPTEFEEELIAIIKKYGEIRDASAEEEGEDGEGPSDILCCIYQLVTLHILGFGSIIHGFIHRKADVILSQASFLASQLGIAPDGFEERAQFLASIFPEDFQVIKREEGESIRDIMKKVGLKSPNHGKNGKDGN